MKTHLRHLPEICVLAAAIVSVPMLQGCLSHSKVETGNVSLGQQLQDLEKAHQNGTINDKEYQDLRKSIMKKYK
jgi:hypothetical protein